ncbi:MAG: hypothetical protein HYZ87_00070 [Candidatus Omnitrophica bacterium]|nr:hypothetical protein [Candidatus Omnitrophota bacterium]
MTPIAELKKRFLSDPTPVRLGAVASDLLRLGKLNRLPAENRSSYEDVLKETKLFTEWTASDLSFEQQLKILRLQRTLARRFSKAEATQWSNKILNLSGLSARPTGKSLS